MNRSWLETNWLKGTMWLLNIFPRSWQVGLKRLGLQKLVSRLVTKSQGELIHQVNWVKVFVDKKEKTRSYWERHRYLNEIVKICRISPETRILDVGCGISSGLHFIEGKKWAIDPLAKIYKQLYQYPGDIQVDEGVGEELPYEDGSFDVCFCTNALDHADDPDRVMKEIHRVLTQGGYCILIVHIYDDKLKGDPVHPQTFARKDGVLALVKDQFKIVWEKESPAVDIYEYVAEGKRESSKKEGVWVLEKI